ncbi:carboxymuconolactone decarboxylase family protein [Methylibium sp.]|uniref:carboxymuconolactone decarboxylase family protein n=1 Tax=Methylibium sp. TaxID=2067992 RepID=UPI003D10D6C6
MSRIPLSENGSTPWERLLGYSPEILQRWAALESAFFASSTFSPELLEQVRRQLAIGNGCEYCIAKSGRPDSVQRDPKTSVAVSFAQLFARDHRDIDEAAFSTLKAEFSEKEIIELLAFMSFFCASQMFGASLGLKPGKTYERPGPNLTMS